MYSFFVASLARRTGCDVFVPDLRLAPEFPFPADLEDATAVLTGLMSGGVDPTHLFVAGDSSGGGLVASLLAAHVLEQRIPVAGTVLFSPEVSMEFDCPSVRENARRDILPWNVPTTAYLHGVDPASPVVSAVLQDVAGWPPTFVSIGGDEIFRDAIRRLCDHLVAAEVDTDVHEEPGMFHVFPILMPWSEAGRRTLGQVGAFVRDRLPGSLADGGGPADGDVSEGAA
jgi:acetyl esterase/lipase